MRLTALLVAIGVSVYLIVLVVTLPARLAWERMAPPDIQAAGVSGTVWRGRAAVVAVPGLPLQDVHWRVRPASLLRGRAALDVEARLDRGFLNGRFEFAPGQRISVLDLQAAFRLEQALAAAGFQGLAGDASLQLERLRLAEGWPRDLDGLFRVGDLLLTEWDELYLGHYEVELGLNADDAIVGLIRDQGGPLELDAGLRLLPNLAWTLEGELRPRDDADEALREVITLLGPPDAAGRHPFGVDGRL